MKPLSPCVQSAIRSLPEEISAWEVVKYLLSIHPEYAVEEIKSAIPDIDASYMGEKKGIDAWLEDVAEKYPDERILHSGLVIVALLEIDPTLKGYDLAKYIDLY